jgi:uncharacterized protein YndB with AHSA1/START domain
MSERSVEHSTFSVERSYDAPPQRVFSAWADPAEKARWFGLTEGAEFELDFKVGGREINKGPHRGTMFTYEARYQDIVPDERIVYSYDMHMGDQRMSVSLATVELLPSGSGTKLIFTEQGAFLDGLDRPEEREGGTGQLLDALESYLSGAEGSS